MYRMRRGQGIPPFKWTIKEQGKRDSLRWRQRRAGESRDKAVEERESFKKWGPWLVTVKKSC